MTNAQKIIGAKLLAVENAGCEHLIDGYEEARKDGFKNKKLECINIINGFSTLYDDFYYNSSPLGDELAVAECKDWLEKIEAGDEYCLGVIQKEIGWMTYNEKLDRRALII